ncbi:MAG: phytanoyl-CoA dioxygenase family protein [Acidiferrobacterales bacterium]|nr:phytanoyl-CoA dioxygenase family protein [Acidiferrobacterales bacterium]
MSDLSISESLIEEFASNGAVCLRGVFKQSWLDTLSVGMEKNFAAPGPSHTYYTPDGEPGGFYDDYCNWSRFAEYRDFVMESPAAEVAARLMSSRSARLYHEHVLVKEPGTREVTPWHHDLPYYGVDGDQLCSIWLPLDAVPQKACPEFISGSHSTGVLYYPRLFVNHQNYAEGHAGFKNIPAIDENREQYDILSWNLEPGDCIVFHMRTIHGAPATVGLESRRRGFSTRWLGDDARFAKRPWKTSPPYPEVNLTPGDAMIHSSFPLVWQAS